MDMISQSEVFMDIEVAAEEVVTQDEIGAEAEQKAIVGDMTRQYSMDLLGASNYEQFLYPEDSSEDEHSFEICRLPMLSQTEKDNVRGSHYKDDCLCWECGKRFQSLELLMRHFRTHKAQVRCNMCCVTFRRMVSLRMHLENVHNNVSLFCTACFLPFKSKWEFNKHLEKHADLKLPPVVLGSLPKTHTSSETNKKIPSGHTESVNELENSVTEVHSISLPSGENLNDSIQETSSLTDLVAKDHAYDDRKDSHGNGIVTTTYALRVRRTKTFTTVFPRESLPESAHQKKIQFFVFRSVDRNEKGSDEGGHVGSEEVVLEDDDVKPDPSSLIPSLPESQESSSCKSQYSQIKQEDVISDSIPVDWEGAPVEEDDELNESLEGNHTDGVDSSHSQDSDSDYNPGDVSDASSESVSSGNSSGSSYRPPRRRVIKPKETDTKRTVTGRKADSSVSGEPVSDCESDIGTNKSSMCPRCGKGPYDLPRNLQHHIAACSKKVAVCTVCNASFSDDIALIDHKVRTHPSIKPSRMYACDSCREVFPQQVIYRHHQCLMKATTKNQPLVSVPASASNIGSDPACTLATSSGPNSFSQTEVTPCAIMTSSLKPTVTAAAVNTELVTTTGNHVSIPSSSLGSCSVTVREPVHMSVSCPLQNPTVVCPVSLSSGPGIQLPGIMLPSSTPSSQSGSMPIMATVVFSGNNAVGRVARVVLQSQALTFPTPTLTQTVSQKQPIRFSSVPTQPKTVGQTQALPSVQLTSLSLRGVIQPHALIRSPQPPGPTAAPLSHRLPVSVPLPDPAQIPLSLSSSPQVSIPLPNPAPGSVPFSNSALVSVPLSRPAPVSVSFSNPAPVSVPFSNSAPVSVPLMNPASVSVPVSVPLRNPASVSVPLMNPASVSVPFTNSAPVSVPLRNPAPVSVPLRNPAPVSVPFKNSAPVSVPLRNPAPVSVLFSNSAPVSVPLRNSAPVSVPLCNSAPVSVPFSNSAPVSVRLKNQAPVSVPFSNSAPVSVTFSNPAPVSVPISNSAPVTLRVNLLAPVPTPAPIPVAPPISAQASPAVQEPLKILGLYVNCSQELALQQRLKKSWRSKGTFFCRQCGAISRQPSLCVRHRYLHRGSRRHRCHCGRTFLRQLHLLRHHIQHAEATRFVCAPCGRTFSGARCLARHKQGRVGEKNMKRRRIRKACQTPFSCDCGQLFQRPTAFLWHKLKNHESIKQS